MRIGDKLTGIITAIKSYGAFVALDNGSTGLIHISEIKPGYVENIYQVLTVGEKVFVQVVDFDEFTQKASLSLRTLEESKHHLHRRRRFSNNQLTIGFQPLADHLEQWIDESLTFLKKE